MPLGAARTQGSSGEAINHFNAVRIRVNGQGFLNFKLRSLDNEEEQNLETISMLPSTNRQVTVLANFIQERCSLELNTDNINEWFRINRIIIYSKPLWAEYPR